MVMYIPPTDADAPAKVSRLPYIPPTENPTAPDVYGMEAMSAAFNKGLTTTDRLGLAYDRMTRTPGGFTDAVIEGKIAGQELGSGVYVNPRGVGAVVGEIGRELTDPTALAIAAATAPIAIPTATAAAAVGAVAGASEFALDQYAREGEVSKGNVALGAASGALLGFGLHFATDTAVKAISKELTKRSTISAEYVGRILKDEADAKGIPLERFLERQGVSIESITADINNRFSGFGKAARREAEAENIGKNLAATRSRKAIMEEGGARFEREQFLDSDELYDAIERSERVGPTTPEELKASPRLESLSKSLGYTDTSDFLQKVRLSIKRREEAYLKAHPRMRMPASQARAEAVHDVVQSVLDRAYRKHTVPKPLPKSEAVIQKSSEPLPKKVSTVTKELPEQDQITGGTTVQIEQPIPGTNTQLELSSNPPTRKYLTNRIRTLRNRLASDGIPADKAAIYEKELKEHIQSYERILVASSKARQAKVAKQVDQGPITKELTHPTDGTVVVKEGETVSDAVQRTNLEAEMIEAAQAVDSPLGRQVADERDLDTRNPADLYEAYATMEANGSYKDADGAPVDDMTVNEHIQDQYSNTSASEFEWKSADRFLVNKQLNEKLQGLPKRFRESWERARTAARLGPSRFRTTTQRMWDNHKLTIAQRFEAYDRIYKVETQQLDASTLTPAEQELRTHWKQESRRLLLKFKQQGIINEYAYRAMINKADTQGWFPRRFNIGFLQTKEGTNAFIKVLEKHLNTPYMEEIVESIVGTSADAKALKAAILTAKRNGEPIPTDELLRLKDIVLRKEAARTFSSIEKSRKLPSSMEKDLEPFMVQDKYAVMMSYVDGGYKRLAYAKEFGNNNEKYKDAIMAIDRIDPKAAAAINESFLVAIQSPASRHFQTLAAMGDPQKKALRIAKAVSLLKLVFAAPLNLTQPFINGTVLQVRHGVPIVKAFTNTMNAYATAMRKANREFGHVSGATYETLFLDDVKGLMDMGLFGAEGTKLNALTNPSLILKAFGFAQIESYNRSVAAITGKYAIQHAIQEIASLDARKAKRGLSKGEAAEYTRLYGFLDTLGLGDTRVSLIAKKINSSPAQLATEVIEGDLGAARIAEAASRFSDAVNFTNDPMHQSAILRHPYSNAALQFKSFLAHNTSNVWDNAVKPAVFGDETGTRNVKPLLTLLGAGAPAGLFVTQLLDKVKGIEREDESTLEGLVRGASTAGTFGLLELLIKKDINGRYSVPSGRDILDTATGPIGSNISAVFDAARGASDTALGRSKKTYGEHFEQFGTRISPAYAAYKRRKEM